MVRVLAFDIGIKNLAWCCVDRQGDRTTILGWDNYNLLADSSNMDTQKRTCAHCTSKANYESQGQQTCVRHCPVGFQALRDLSGTLLKKLPSVTGMKELLQSVGCPKPPSKKQALLEELEKRCSLPIQTKKVIRAPDVGLSELHDAMRTLVGQQKALWSTCHTVLLENQPVLKNPTMKSVQMLLFATLRDLLQPIPIVKLVHAGKKVKGVAVGDAGYKDRKAGSEARAEAFLKSEAVIEPVRWQVLWAKAPKKSDLADALAMCLDWMV
jgi:hypothetical protein